MHNWFAIETEAEFRRQEWQRAMESEARAEQARARRVGKRGGRLPHLSLARLRGLGAPRLPFGSSLASRRAAAYPAK